MPASGAYLLITAPVPGSCTPPASPARSPTDPGQAVHTPLSCGLGSSGPHCPGLPLSAVWSPPRLTPPSDSWVLPLSGALSRQQPQLPPHSGPFFCRQPPTGQGRVLCPPACPGKGCVRGLRGPQGSQSPGAPGIGPVCLAHQALEKCQLN